MAGSNSSLAREVLIKREGAPYTAEALVAGDGILDLREIGFIEPDLKRIDNANVAKNTWGSPAPQFETAAAIAKLRVVTPIRAPAANGSIPPAAISELLFAGGLKETISAGVKVTYTPQTPADIDLAQTATLGVYEAGKVHSLVGARGDLTLSGQPGQPLLLSADLSAPWLAPTADAATPAVADPSGAPLTFTGATAVTEGGGAIDIGSFELTLQNTVEEHVYAGGVKIYVTNFNPVIKINPIAVATAVEWDQLTGSATLALIADFNGCKITAAQAHAVDMGSEDRNGRVGRTKVWECKESAGDDHFEIEFTASV